MLKTLAAILQQLAYTRHTHTHILSACGILLGLPIPSSTAVSWLSSPACVQKKVSHVLQAWNLKMRSLVESWQNQQSQAPRLAKDVALKPPSCPVSGDSTCDLDQWSNGSGLFPVLCRWDARKASHRGLFGAVKFSPSETSCFAAAQRFETDSCR